MKTYNKYDNQQLFYLLSEEDNKTAFTELYNRFWQQLFAIAYNRVKEKETAEDIVHDVFASLWINRKKVKIESLESYLAVAVKYAVLGKIRKKIKERELEHNIETTSVIDLLIEESIHNRRILEIVKEEVEKLPEKCKLIFKYSREEGMPVKQIARELHLSPKTVENQLTKAIRQLRLATQSFFHSFF